MKSDNVKRSYEQKLKNGEWIGKAPIGYINTRTTDGKPTIEVDSKAAPFVIKIFELYATGNFSLITLTKRMRDEGFVGKNGNPIAMSKLAIILKTPFYYGMMETRGKQYPHHYEPLIPMNVFVKCQKVSDSWNKKQFQHSAKPFIFRGLMTCANCGCTITPEMSKGTFIYYHCTNFKGNCKKLYIPEKELLKPIYSYLKKFKLPKEGIDYVVRDLRKSTEAEQQFHSNAMEGLRIEYDRIEARISKMTDDKYDGSITPEMYDKKLKEYKTKQSDFLQQMNDHSLADQEYHLTASRLLSICKRAFEIFESSEPAEKRVFLNFILQNSTLNARKPVFTLKPVFQGIVKAHDTHNWGELRDTFRTMNWEEMRDSLEKLDAFQAYVILKP